MTDSRDQFGAPAGSDENDLARNDWPEIVRQVRARTPARLLVGRAGASYRTDTQLDLRAAHAAARDAVRVELDLDKHYGAAFTAQFGLFEVTTLAANKEEYLLRPDLGRQFSAESRSRLLQHCQGSPDLQIVLGDGLSVTAVSLQGPPVFRLLEEGAKARKWSLGQVFAIRHCRVGILNEIGELLDPKVVVLLIGERPGLATAESLSAYMAYRPREGHSDSDRNLISNIHARGAKPEDAAVRILNLAARIMQAGASGYSLREGPAELMGD